MPYRSVPAGAQGGCGGANCDEGRAALEDAASALAPYEPHDAGKTERGGEEEVEPQTEHVVGRVDAQRLLEDAKARVAGDVEREDARWADAPAAEQRE